MSMNPPINDDDGDPGSDNLRDVRRYAERQEAQAKQDREAREAAENRVAELEAEKQTAEVQAAAKAKGLTDAQWASLTALNPNPTVEAVEKFAEAFVTDQLPQGDANQPEDLMPGTTPDTETPTGSPPTPIGGSLPPAKAFTTDDFARAARMGDEGALRQMAEAVVRDPSRLKLKHPDMQPVGNDL